jgi:VWFA-related protein
MRIQEHFKAIKTLQFSVILLLTVTGALHAEDLPFTLKVDVSLVSLDVAVYDVPGRPVTDLTPKDFILTEDGIPQEIRHFEPMDAPYSSLLLFDVSGSTQGQIPFMLEAANSFLGSLRLQDRIAIASFDTRVVKLMDWRTRQGTYQQVAVPSSRGGTDLYSSLRWAAFELGQQSGRKGVIILTDGHDYRMFPGQPAEIEEREFQSLLKVVEESRTPFYFVAYNASQKKAVDRMTTLAERSGGRVLFAKSIEDIASLYQAVAREWTASYRLSYHSTRPQADGTYRRIQVGVHMPGFRTTQSRTGYWANRGKEERISSAPEPRSAARGNAQPASAEVPVLMTPIHQALLSTPGKDPWRFTWEEVPNALNYEIQINDPKGATVLNSESRGARFVYRKPVYAAERNPGGWSWKVRAQIANGAWGPWSEPHSFEVFQE